VGQVQVVNETYWNAAADGQSLDLGGELATGTIAQTFATVPGQAYEVTYQYSANPESADPAPQMNVAINAVTFGPPISHARAGDGPLPHTITWDPGTLSFIADSSNTTLSFEAVGGSLFGIALDEVKVVADLTAAPPPVANVDTPYLYRADPGAGNTHIEGVLGATPSTLFALEFLVSDTCSEDGQLGGTPDVVGTANVTTGSTGRADIDATIAFVPDGLTFLAARVTSPGTSNLGPCIVVTDANDAWTNATARAGTDSPCSRAARSR
jgi:hypothetical protein